MKYRAVTPTDPTTPFKDSVLTSSPLYTDETRSANAALLTRHLQLQLERRLGDI